MRIYTKEETNLIELSRIKAKQSLEERTCGGGNNYKCVSCNRTFTVYKYGTLGQYDFCKICVLKTVSPSVRISLFDTYEYYKLNVSNGDSI